MDSKPHSMYENEHAEYLFVNVLAPHRWTGATEQLRIDACYHLARLVEQNERLTQNIIDCNERSRSLAEKVIGLEEQLQALQVALSFYAEKGGDGGAVARSVLKNERPPEHVFAFFRELHGVSTPAKERP